MICNSRQSTDGRSKCLTAFPLRLSFGLLILPLVFNGCEYEAADGYNTSLEGSSTNTLQAASTNTTQVVTTNTTVVAANDFDLSSVEVKGGKDFRRAQTTVALTSCGLSGGKVSLTWTPHTWPPYDGMSDGYICAVWQQGGKWIGGYIDWCPANRSGYTWSAGNIHEYGSPASGSQVGFFIMSVDCKQRSNVLFATWP